ncbi:MAG: photosynthetic complex putative assembly protein PuhB [Acidibrevibacterium sp.]|uniref:photosynthetic complex putative assembly protein PuhB n=1 Tax=Acidibrevibacterium sp. TaxID=2606776 RepID=UPI003CFF036D
MSASRELPAGRLRKAGLPGPLPAGEDLLWQGEPSVIAVARYVLHLPVIALYFAALLVWRLAVIASGGGTAMAMAAAFGWIVLLATMAFCLMAGIAWLIARTTCYTITSRRVVMHFGMALSASINLPFRCIEAAAVKIHRQGSGDIALTLGEDERISALILWPHVRARWFGPTEPALRALPDAARAARVLARAMAADAAQRVPAMPVSIVPPPPIASAAGVRA